MCKCPECGYDPDFLECDFSNCKNEAEFEGWYRPLDPITNEPFGLIQKMIVCKSCVKFMIGYKEQT